MQINEKLWVLDKTETLALSAWLSEAESIRREINKLVFDHWDEAKDEKALSRSLLRRYVAYRHAYEALVQRESTGVHGGTYSEELIASVIRAKFANTTDEIEIRQSHWDRTAYREADICLLRGDQPLVVIEVKSALTKDELRKAAEARESWSKLPAPPSYWVAAIRAEGLDAKTEDEVNADPHCCVLSKQGRKILSLPEEKLEIWKPIEPWLDSLATAVSQ